MDWKLMYSIYRDFEVIKYLSELESHERILEKLLKFDEQLTNNIGVQMDDKVEMNTENTNNDESIAPISTSAHNDEQDNGPVEGYEGDQEETGTIEVKENEKSPVPREQTFKEQLVILEEDLKNIQESIVVYIRELSVDFKNLRAHKDCLDAQKPYLSTIASKLSKVVEAIRVVK